MKEIPFMKLIEKELEKIELSRLFGKKVMLCGRIEHVQQMIYWLKARGIFTEAILDNDRKKEGLFVEQIPIYNPNKKLQIYNEKAFIIIYSPKYWEEWLEQLQSLGYQEEQIIVLDRPSIRKNIELVQSGCEIYKRFQEEYGKDVKIFIANCPLGDYYLLGLFFHQYCRLNHIKNYVVAGESTGIEKLSDMLGIKHRKRLSTEGCNALIRAWMFLGEEEINLQPLTIWQGAFRFNPCLTRQKGQFTFMDTFKKMIYDLPDEIKPEFPKLTYQKEKILQIFEENQLEIGNTILLSPFSYSLQSLPMTFWEDLTRELRKKGYKVAVNIGEDREENHIPDTVTLKLDFMTIMGVMEYAGTVIGMRSGFFDITSQAKCKRVILYPKSVGQTVNWNSTDISFCNLKVMGLCEDAFEWEVEEEEQIIEKIKRIV